MSKTRKNTARRGGRKTSDALEILNAVTGDDPALREAIEEATVNAMVAEAIYNVRTEAGITQAELAERIGSTQPVISQLEDADYEGHSLSMLKRIADALRQRVEIRFVPVEQRA